MQVFLGNLLGCNKGSIRNNSMKQADVKPMDLISFGKYLCSFVTSGKACCTFNILCRFTNDAGLQSNSGILLGLYEKLIFLHLDLHQVSSFRNVVVSSITGCLRILGPASGVVLSSFSLKVLSEI